MKDASYWIQQLAMIPHPDGGYFKETYRSADTIDPAGLADRYPGPRSAGTGIYYLLAGQSVNTLHRLKSDEMWHFYAGETLTLHIFRPDGNYQEIKMGSNPDQMEVFQAVVEHGCWFGASLASDKGYALVGCTVAPGFDFADLEMADRETLLAQFPDQAQVITRLTP